jgi:ATP-binding cassette subfamily B (MDR/TAP) protein 1
MFSFTSSAPLIEDVEDEKKAMERRGTRASSRRRPSTRRPVVRTRWDDAKIQPMTNIKIDLPSEPAAPEQAPSQLSVWALVRALYPTVPYKAFVVFGVLVCLISGALTPIFSYLLSQLFYEVATGAKNTSMINKYGFIVLSTAALDGIFIGLKYFIMETTSMSWITKVRKACFERVLAQDKKWFDKAENAPVRLVQVLIKDGDDARNMIAVVLGQLAVVTSMLGVGLVWALVKGWQLTLVGFAIAPVFAVTMAVQTGLVAKCELRNKRAREEVAKGYYEVRFPLFKKSLERELTQRAGDFERPRNPLHGLREHFPEAVRRGIGQSALNWCEGRFRRRMHVRRRQWTHLPRRGSTLLCRRRAHRAWNLLVPANDAGHESRSVHRHDRLATHGF